MIFDWDPRKAERNAAKHGVTFEQASEVFSDPDHLASDDIFDGTEQRYSVIGMSGDLLLLLVVCSFRGDEIVRIISARKANSYEREAYTGQYDES